MVHVDKTKGLFGFKQSQQTLIISPKWRCTHSPWKASTPPHIVEHQRNVAARCGWPCLQKHREQIEVWWWIDSLPRFLLLRQPPFPPHLVVRSWASFSFHPPSSFLCTDSCVSAGVTSSIHPGTRKHAHAAPCPPKNTPSNLSSTHFTAITHTSTEPDFWIS